MTDLERRIEAAKEASTDWSDDPGYHMVEVTRALAASDAVLHQLLDELTRQRTLSGFEACHKVIAEVRAALSSRAIPPQVSEK